MERKIIQSELLLAMEDQKRQEFVYIPIEAEEINNVRFYIFSYN